MKKSTIIMLSAVLVVVVLAIVAYRLLGTMLTPKVEHRLSQVGLTANEVAANGPLPGDVGRYQEELECCEGLWTPGYYPSLNAAELADAQRSAVFPCVEFTGSFDGPNQVYAWRSEDEYEACSFLCNRRPGELYVVGGDNPPFEGQVPPGPFVARADATTGKEVWRVYLDNANVSKHFIAGANLNILESGNVAFA